MTTGIFAGTFDPITLGHLNIIKRSLKFCDKLIVAIGYNSAKKTMFSLEERVFFIKENISSLSEDECSKIEVDSYSDLLVSYAKQKNASLLIRGVRSNSDFEYENQLGLINKRLDLNIETVLLLTEQNLSTFSSSAVKELARYEASIYDMVTARVAEAVYNKLGVKNGI